MRPTSTDALPVIMKTKWMHYGHKNWMITQSWLQLNTGKKFNIRRARETSADVLAWKSGIYECVSIYWTPDGINSLLKFVTINEIKWLAAGGPIVSRCSLMGLKGHSKICTEYKRLWTHGWAQKSVSETNNKIQLTMTKREKKIFCHH